MARVRVHPCQDDSLDHLRFVPVDKMDPRFAGEGPCGLAHQFQTRPLYASAAADHPILLDSQAHDCVYLNALTYIATQ